MLEAKVIGFPVRAGAATAASCVQVQHSLFPARDEGRGKVAVQRAQAGQRREQPLGESKAQWLQMLGKKRGATPWPAGTYTAQYKVIRGDKGTLEKTFTVNLAPSG